MKEVKSKVPSAGNLTSNSFADQISGLSTTLSDSITSSASNVKNTLSSSLESLSSGVSSTLSNLFGSTSSAQTKVTDSSNKGTVEVESKLKNISSDSASAIAQPVSFVSKKSADVISGTDVSSMKISDLSNVSQDAMSALSKATGTSITDNTSFADAITSVSNDIASKISTVPDTISSAISSVTTPASSTLSDFTSSIKSGLTSVADFASPVTSSVGALVNGASTIAKSAVSILPPSMQSYVSGLSNSYLSNAVNDALGDKASSFNNILGKLTGVSTTDDMLSKFTNLLNGTAYDKLLDASGNSVSTNYGTASDSQISTLYSAANTVCSAISTDGYITYGDNKDLYDMLLQYASELGLTDLLLQMQNCSAGGNTNYFDSRSSSILNSSSNKTAMTGNGATYLAVQNLVGAQNVTDAETDALTLIANAKTTTDDPASLTSNGVTDSTNEQSVATVLNRFNITPTSLVTETVGDQEVIDANKLVVMGTTNKYFSNTVVDPNTRTMIEASVAVFS